MTNEEKKKIYQLLSAPFSEDAIERTDGRITGRGYSTTGIKYQFVVNRLNEVLGLGCYRAHRTVTVKEVSTAKGRQAFEAICDITLELGQWVDGEFVMWAEALADGGHTATSEADARKGAYTNAFKKAAAFFGVGRQAYEGTLDDDNVSGIEPNEFVSPAEQRPQPPNLNVVPATGIARSAGGGRTRLTSKQLAALWSIARRRNIGQGEFRSQVKAQYGVQPEYLSREQASALIGSMGNGHAADYGQVGEQAGIGG
ncbi:MAG TPA: Rad52/Rad22 family DNA repair protein [Vulgatibacter sp.]